MEEGDTLVNALIGGILTFVLAGFVPLAPVLGGGVAGYLEGGSRNDGLKVGAIAGFIAMIPFVLLVVFAGSILGAIGIGMPMMGPEGALFGVGAGLGLLFIFIALVFGLLYIVGLSAVGGWLGNYVKYDTDVDL